MATVLTMTPNHVMKEHTGTSLFSIDKKGNNALHLAVKYKDTMWLAELIQDNSAELDTLDYKGYSALRR